MSTGRAGKGREDGSGHFPLFSSHSSLSSSSLRFLLPPVRCSSISAHPQHLSTRLATSGGRTIDGSSELGGSFFTLPPSSFIRSSLFSFYPAVLLDGRSSQSTADLLLLQTCCCPSGAHRRAINKVTPLISSVFLSPCLFWEVEHFTRAQPTAPQLLGGSTKEPAGSYEGVGRSGRSALPLSRCDASL